MQQVFGNGVKTRLNGSLTDSATTATVNDGSVFPSLSGDEMIIAKLTKLTSGDYEIVHITAIATNDLTIERGKEGSTAIAFDNGDDVEMVITSGMLANFAQLGRPQEYTAGQSGKPVALSSSSNSVAVDMADANNFSLDMTENTTLAAPSNPTEGQSGHITITQDDTTAYTLAYNSFWKFEGGSAPTLSTTLSSVNTFVYYVNAGGASATCKLIGDVA